MQNRYFLAIGLVDVQYAGSPVVEWPSFDMPTATADSLRWSHSHSYYERLFQLDQNTFSPRACRCFQDISHHFLFTSVVIPIYSFVSDFNTFPRFYFYSFDREQ